jgi:hypothetical protein
MICDGELKDGYPAASQHADALSLLQAARDTPPGDVIGSRPRRARCGGRPWQAATANGWSWVVGQAAGIIGGFRKLGTGHSARSRSSCVLWAGCCYCKADGGAVGDSGVPG